MCVGIPPQNNGTQQPTSAQPASALPTSASTRGGQVRNHVPTQVLTTAPVPAGAPSSFPYADGIEDLVTQHLKQIYVTSRYEDLMITKAVTEKLCVGTLHTPGAAQPVVSGVLHKTCLNQCR